MAAVLSRELRAGLARVGSAPGRRRSGSGRALGPGRGRRRLRGLSAGDPRPGPATAAEAAGSALGPGPAFPGRPRGRAARRAWAPRMRR